MRAALAAVLAVALAGCTTRDAWMRLCEEGHAFTGEAFVVPSAGRGTPEELQELVERVERLDWKLYDIAVQPVPRAPDAALQSAPYGGRAHDRSSGRD